MSLFLFDIEFNHTMGDRLRLSSYHFPHVREPRQVIDE